MEESCSEYWVGLRNCLEQATVPSMLNVQTLRDTRHEVRCVGAPFNYAVVSFRESRLHVCHSSDARNRSGKR